MAQRGSVYPARGMWYLRYWIQVQEAGKLKWKQKAVQLAPVSEKYRCERDLDDIRVEKLAGIQQAQKCPISTTSFNTWVEETYLPFASANLKPSTYAGYKTYFERYIKPRTAKYALRDFTISIVAQLLKSIAGKHRLNTATIMKIRSVLSAAFSFAISEGHYPARSADDNPAHEARIPKELTSKPKKTQAASREQVTAILAALKELPLEHAAVAIHAMLGTRPGEARGLRWSDWDRANQQISIQRAVWHRHEGDPKTPQSVRLVPVSAELREILLTLWQEQGRPIDGYILAGVRKKDGKLRPVLLDNLAKRSVADALNRCAVCHEPESAKHEGHKYQRDDSLPVWPGWYGFRRFHGTQVRAKSNLETTSKALGNSPSIVDKHYLKPTEVLPDVREAVNASMSGLVQ